MDPWSCLPREVFGLAVHPYSGLRAQQVLAVVVLEEAALWAVVEVLVVVVVLVVLVVVVVAVHVVVEVAGSLVVADVL